jgi:hypothetical protein
VAQSTAGWNATDVLGKLLEIDGLTDRPTPFTVSVAVPVAPLVTVYTMVDSDDVETPPTLYWSAPEKSSPITNTVLLM